MQRLLGEHTYILKFNFAHLFLKANSISYKLHYLSCWKIVNFLILKSPIPIPLPIFDKLKKYPFCTNLTPRVSMNLQFLLFLRNPNKTPPSMYTGTPCHYLFLIMLKWNVCMICQLFTSYPPFLCQFFSPVFLPVCLPFSVILFVTPFSAKKRSLQVIWWKIWTSNIKLVRTYTIIISM